MDYAAIAGVGGKWGMLEAPEAPARPAQPFQPLPQSPALFWLHFSGFVNCISHILYFVFLNTCPSRQPFQPVPQFHPRVFGIILHV